MNRRAFLAGLAAGLAGATLDPERLLWRPGAKTFFLPSVPQGWALHANGLLLAGDFFTIQGVMARNPITGSNTSHEQIFVVTDHIEADGVIRMEQIYPSPSQGLPPGRHRVRPFRWGIQPGAA